MLSGVILRIVKNGLEYRGSLSPEASEKQARVPFQLVILGLPQAAG